MSCWHDSHQVAESRVCQLDWQWKTRQTPDVICHFSIRCKVWDTMIRIVLKCTALVCTVQYYKGLTSQYWLYIGTVLQYTAIYHSVQNCTMKGVQASSGGG